MDDAALLVEFESGELPRARAHDAPDGLDAGYHETLTTAWLTLVAARMGAAPVAPDSEAFCAGNPDLLDPALLRQFYSSERIVTWRAKRE